MTGSAKRLFFALWPDPDLADAIQNRTHGLVYSARGRPVSAEKLHITLAFLHTVDTAIIPAVIAAAGGISSRCFDLSLSKIGIWYRSRILWLGPDGQTDGHRGARDLAQSLWAALEPVGFTPERRPFVAHVTLARKVQRPVRFPDGIDPLIWRVRSFALVESLTGRRPAGYRVLETFALGDA